MINYTYQEFTGIGKRFENEDCHFPSQLVNEPSVNNLFIVCDGVGGSSYGQLASLIVCKSIVDFFASHYSNKMDKHFLSDAVKFAESKLANEIKENPICKGMATTLTLVYLDLHERLAYLVHAGDSRIYYYRNHGLLFQTRDHSEINALLDSGRLKLSEVENFTPKNRITRAINGSKSTDVDIKLITNLQLNDMIFLCSDGITEVFPENKLNQLLTTDKNLEEKKENIVHACANKDTGSKDNYTAVLVELLV